MAGKLSAVWVRTWTEIWAPLARSNAAPADLFMELIQALMPGPPPPPELPPPPPPEAFDMQGELRDVSAIANRDIYEALSQEYQKKRDQYETALSGVKSRAFFRQFILAIKSENIAVKLLEDAWHTIETFENPALSTRYQYLVRSLFIRYSVRYDIREPFILHATLPGMFSEVMESLKLLSQKDEHLHGLFAEFEEALADLRGQKTQMRMKNCLQKQFVILEAFAARWPGVKGQTLGAMCDELDWPHSTIKEVVKKLYGFRSNYPGLGHAGNGLGVIRQVNMRDFVSLSLVLAAFTPYVAHGLDADRCYSAG